MRLDTLPLEPEISPPINNMKVFTKLDSKICVAALGIIEKKTSSMRTLGIPNTTAGAKLISCAQFNSMLLSATELVNAQSMEGQLNYQWYGPNMAEVIPYLDYTANKLDEMTPKEISLFRAAVGHDRLPGIVKAKVAAIQLATPELIQRGPAAIEKLRINPNSTASGGNGTTIQCTLPKALEYIETGVWGC